MNIDEMTVEQICDHLNKRPINYVLAWIETPETPECLGAVESNLFGDEKLHILSQAYEFVSQYG